MEISQIHDIWESMEDSHVITYTFDDFVQSFKDCGIDVVDGHTPVDEEEPVAFVPECNSDDVEDPGITEVENVLLYMYSAGDGTVKDFNMCTAEDDDDVDKRFVFMHYADSNNWTASFRNMTRAFIEDNGNGIKIMSEGREPIEMDYGEAVDFMMLLRYYDEDSGFSQFESSLRKMIEVK